LSINVSRAGMGDSLMAVRLITVIFVPVTGTMHYLPIGAAIDNGACAVSGKGSVSTSGI